MGYRLSDLLDIRSLQAMLDSLHEAFTLPSAITDNEGNILTATAWQDVCTKFHRVNPETEQMCIQSDRYILSHLDDSGSSVTYKCPHGLVDNATPIIIGGKHLGNVFTGQFFLEPPDLDYFREQAAKYGFGQNAYLEAVSRVPVVSRDQLKLNLAFLRQVASVLGEMGMKRMKELESEARFRGYFELPLVGVAFVSPDRQWIEVNDRLCAILGYPRRELITKSWSDITYPDDLAVDSVQFGRVADGKIDGYSIDMRLVRKSGGVVWASVAVRRVGKTDPRVDYVVVSVEDITERKHAEEALRESEQHFRQLFDHMESGLAVYEAVDDGADFVLTEFNPAAERATHTQRKDVLGRRVSEVFPGVQQLGLFDVFQRVWRTGAPEHHPAARYRDERLEMWTENYVSKLPSGEIYAIFSDVTNRKQAEDALRESEERLRALFDASPDAIAVADLNEAPGESRLAIVNQHMAQRFGFQSSEAMTGRDAMELVAPNDQPRIAEDMAHLAATGKPFTAEYRMVAGDGEHFFAELSCALLRDATGRPESVVSIGRDTTERHRAEEALRRSESYYRSIFENSLYGIVATGPDFRFEQVNDAFCRLLGYDLEELVGKKSIEDITYPDDRATTKDMLGRHATGEIDRFVVEKRYVSKSGRVIEAVTFAHALYDESGRYTGGTAAIMDVTERKRAEQEIRRLNTDLEQRVEERTAELAAANKELESFAYSASHDLRAPLRHIDAWSRALEEEYGDKLDDTGKRYLSIVRSHTRQMGELIEALLQLSRVARQEMRRGMVNLSRIAHTIEGELRAAHPDRVTDVSVAPDMKAYGDPVLLRVLMENLLGNAWKFTEKRERASIELGVIKQHRQKVFYVRDNGAGFDMEYASKLFTPFQRLHRADEFPGTGVGLATVHRVISRHGGRVWAEGKVDKGATFYFTLPSPRR